MQSNSLVVESQPDWLTITRPLAAGDRAMIDLYEQLRIRELTPSQNPSTFRLQGFTVYRAGRVSYGTSPDRELLQLSGAFAAEHLDAALVITPHVTRIDLAVTIRQEPFNQGWAEEQHQHGIVEYSANPRYPVPSRTSDARGGITAYWGKRTGDRFTRLYNKAAECREHRDTPGERRYRDCWRWEVECKGQLAPRLAAALRSADDRNGAVQSWVWRWAVDHNLEPGFSECGDRLLLPGFHRRADDDRSIHWLDTQVIPVLRRLVEHGRGDDVRRALGGLTSNAEADTPVESPARA